MRIDALETKPSEIETLHERLNSTGWVILCDEVVQKRGEQCALISGFTYHESLYRHFLSGPW